MKTALSPRNLAEAIGVSESSIKRWVDEGRIEAFRTAGGHRRIRVSEALRAVREGGFPVLRPDLLGMPELATQTEAMKASLDLTRMMIDALTQGRAEDARGILFGAWLGGTTVAELLDGPLAGAMRHIGTLWRHEREGIVIEHRASDICEQTLHLWRTILPPPQPHAPVAVGGAPRGDGYSLPALMAATTLASEGFREINLSKETPIETLMQAAARYEAKLVYLAMSVDMPPAQQARLAREVDQLADQLVDAEAHLVLGGRAVPDVLVSRRRSGILVLNSFTEMAAFARGLRAAGE